jgi:transposase
VTLVIRFPRGGDSRWAFLIARIEEKADMIMPELAAELASATGTRADPASLSRWLIRNGYRFKKTLAASEQDRPDIKSCARRMDDHTPAAYAA